MRIQADTTMVRAADGVEVAVAAGTKVLLLDDRGDKQRLGTEHIRPNDWPVMHEGLLHFVNRHELVRG